MRADVLHCKFLYRRRYRFGAEGAHFQGRHIVARHFLRAGRISHHSLEEGRARLEQRDLVALDNRGKPTRVGEER